MPKEDKKAGRKEKLTMLHERIKAPIYAKNNKRIKSDRNVFLFQLRCHTSFFSTILVVITTDVNFVPLSSHNQSQQC